VICLSIIKKSEILLKVEGRTKIEYKKGKKKTTEVKVEKEKVYLKKLRSATLYGKGIDTGSIVSVKDGVARVKGLVGVLSGEMVLLGESKVKGMVLSLEHTIVSIVFFGNDTLLKQGDKVSRTFVIMNIPLSTKLFGRVIDALGNTIDAGPKVTSSLSRKVDTKAIGIIGRQSVREPMQTGVNAIDAITPIGCGQRELIIGDRQTGKTTIAVDTILSQKKFGSLYCIYVAVGQKKSTIAQIVQFLKKSDALGNTIIVSAASSEPATLQFLAPYSGCTLGE